MDDAKTDANSRAGLPPLSDDMRELITATLASSAIDIFGFYCHNGGKSSFLLGY